MPCRFDVHQPAATICLNYTQYTSSHSHTTLLFSASVHLSNLPAAEGFAAVCCSACTYSSFTPSNSQNKPQIKNNPVLKTVPRRPVPRQHAQAPRPSSGEEDGPAAIGGGLGGAVGALEGAHGALGDALQRLLGQHMAAGQQHGRVVGRALLARHRAREHAVEHELASQLQLLHNAPQ